MTEAASIRRLITSEEGQHFDRALRFAGRPRKKRHRDRREVRGEVAEYVAALANADSGMLILGVEDDGTPTGCPHQDEVRCGGYWRRQWGGCDRYHCDRLFAMALQLIESARTRHGPIWFDRVVAHHRDQQAAGS